MALSADDVSMALFCDFENIALGVRDAQYEKFDIKPVLERLLLKGSIVVKKAYCDWERYKSHKATMHEANFELIEIPHVRQSGKNSADIRMVVDALDLCYTKAHVNTFVIISGDSDFSPLVSKLRENAKRVIGVGVKQSTSDLLIANCDEFIYIDDLVRKRQQKEGGDRQNRKPVDPQEMEARRAKCLELAVSTLEALLEDRADDEKVWASVLKEAIKRRNPGFNENYFGYRTLGAMLEDAHKRGLLEFGRENNSAFVRRRLAGAASALPEPEAPVAEPAAVPPALTIESAPAPEAKPKRRARKPKAKEAQPAAAPAPVVAAEPAEKPARKSRAPRRKKAEASA
ncbi:MAG: NYN domain-containing protein [Pseudomonadota bacterium]